MLRKLRTTPLLLATGLTLTVGCQTHDHRAGIAPERPARSEYQAYVQRREAALQQRRRAAAQAALEDTVTHRGPARPVGLLGQVPAARPGVELNGMHNAFQVTFTTEGADFDPAVEPTGQSLVYASTRHRTTADLYLKRVNGHTVTQLTSDPANDVMPAISPDGNFVAFASDRTGHWDIYIMDLRGGQPIQLTREPSQDIHPSWSPDGKRLVYSSLSERSGQWEMVVIDVENPAVRRFIGYGLFPRWSPVDDHILFQRARERGTRWFSLWKVELVNGEAMRPTELLAAANAAAITPSWSPDGRHIVFSTVLNDGGNGVSDAEALPNQADVWIMDIHGNGRMNLTNNQYANTQPVWAGDGTIFYVSNGSPSGIDNIWALRPARSLAAADRAGQGSTDVRQAANTPAAIKAPVVEEE